MYKIENERINTWNVQNVFLKHLCIKKIYIVIRLHVIISKNTPFGCKYYKKEKTSDTQVHVYYVTPFFSYNGYNINRFCVNLCAR